MLPPIHVSISFSQSFFSVDLLEIIFIQVHPIFIDTFISKNQLILQFSQADFKALLNLFIYQHFKFHLPFSFLFMKVFNISNLILRFIIKHQSSHLSIFNFAF